MKGDVKRNTSPSGDNPDTRMQSGQPAQLRVRRTDVPAVEERQCINDMIRKLISKWTIRADHRSI
jgi:hypothetical protein